ncbi:hypothetical protein EDC01DRAFT_473304 [Geopyxis carbonaria]|nr:hypothetical protein EDC01DRAFT_473304 [Geopyxis carbonaria]
MPIATAGSSRKTHRRALVTIDVVALAFLVGIVCLFSGGGGVAAQQLHTVAVGRSGDDLALQFSPEEITADVGDMVQFQFYPLNHSTVEASFDAPCVPINNTQKRQGFFSGFNPLPRDTKTLNTFTIRINTTDPIFFYCSQGRHCQQGFVGAINPTPTRSLAAFKAAAALAPFNLSPGELPPRQQPQTPRNPFAGRNRTTSASNANLNSSRVTNVGAIVGGVLGGVVFMIVAFTAAVFGIMRRRDRIEARRREGQGNSGKGGKGGGGTRSPPRSRGIDVRAIGKPMLESGSGPFGSGRV